MYQWGARGQLRAVHETFERVGQLQIEINGAAEQERQGLASGAQGACVVVVRVVDRGQP